MIWDGAGNRMMHDIRLEDEQHGMGDFYALGERFHVSRALHPLERLEAKQISLLSRMKGQASRIHQGKFNA